ncbi:hypothetical protein C8R44DRAFT_846798 [Mycena epipterygia]|nr:hypothetical protein C8R44DRAFT_846798 [Mycena epipterygia]
MSSLRSRTTLNPAFTALSDQEKIDIKRASGKAPCAECKRLKLKCDKNIPCAACVRRGCGETCPTGTYLPTGRGKRTVPTEASRLKRAMSEMENRIKELETAVTSACGYHLNYCPLLGIPPQSDSSADQLADNLGALSVNDTGDTQYFGPTAGTEALLSIETNIPQSAPTFAAVTESFSVQLGGTLAWNPEHALVQLFLQLPPRPRAWELAELYFQNGCWSGTSIMRDELFELLSQVYGPASCSLHQMAVIYGVFALGALVDLALPPYNTESECYFDLGRAALSVRSVFEHPSTAAIQALVLVSVFYSHGGPRFSMESAWSTISLASNISQNMGLHRGRFQPELTPIQVQQQRALFWETYAIETLQSLSVGRPTGTYLANISCPFPTDCEQQMDDAGNIRHGYYHRRWQFIKQVAAPIMEMYLTAQAPDYDVIVNLDQRIRKFMHSPMCTNLGSDDDLKSPSAGIQHRMIHQYCTIMLLYIHNNAFVRAMRVNPKDPYYTSQATSFLSAYRCASEIIRDNIGNFSRHPELFLRWWPIWKSLFNAAIIVGGIAAQCPQNSYAPRALLELFVVTDLFERGAASCFRARSALAILKKLRDKATTAYAKHSKVTVESDAALDIFSGRTRVVARTILATHNALPETYPVPSPDTEAAHHLPFPSAADPSALLDPSLVQYFSPEFDTGVRWDGADYVDGYNATLFESGGTFNRAQPDAFLHVNEDAFMPAFFLEDSHNAQWAEFLQGL